MAKVPPELHGIRVKDIAAICHVDLSTARRWKRGATCPPKSALQLLTGDLGILDPAWSGWIVRDGTLVSPENWIIPRNEVLAVPLLRAQLAAYVGENRVMKAELLAIELGRDLMDEQPLPQDWPSQA